MSPYSIPLNVIPAGIMLFASFLKNKWMSRGLLLTATVAFWVILQPHVHWTFSHPFNPNDGGPKVFALFFGWAYGLVLIVTPLYWISRGTQAIVHKLKNRQNRHQTPKTHGVNENDRR